MNVTDIEDRVSKTAHQAQHAAADKAAMIGEIAGRALTMALAGIGLQRKSSPMGAMMAFGAGFVAGYDVMVILFFGIMTKALVGPGEVLLTMSGHQALCVKLYVAALAVNIGLNVVLLPLFTIVDGYRRGLRRPWLYFVSSLFTSCAFAYAFYFATMERQHRHAKAAT